MPKQIANKELKLADVPLTLATWNESAQEFALTFDGFEHHGSFEACAKIANDMAPTSLTEYRTCLFFEQRRWRHFDSDPQGKDLVYLNSLLEGIRNKIKSGALD